MCRELNCWLLRAALHRMLPPAGETWRKSNRNEKRNTVLGQNTMSLNFAGKPEPSVEQHTRPCTSICLSSCLSVCVFCVRGSVLDVNDETPTFNPRVYNVSLKESVPRDHIVARLTCSDNDAGLNAELSYFITGQRSQWWLFLSVPGLQCCTVMVTVCTCDTFVHPSISVCLRWAPLACVCAVSMWTDMCD